MIMSTLMPVSLVNSAAIAWDVPSTVSGPGTHQTTGPSDWDCEPDPELPPQAVIARTDSATSAPASRVRDTDVVTIHSIFISDRLSQGRGRPAGRTTSPWADRRRADVEVR